MDGWSDIKDRQRETDIWMDEQTYRKVEGQREKQTERQTNGWQEVYIRHTHRQTKQTKRHGCEDIQKDGCAKRQTDIKME